METISAEALANSRWINSGANCLSQVLCQVFAGCFSISRRVSMEGVLSGNFFRMGNREKMVRYAKLHRNWTEMMNPPQSSALFKQCGII